MKVIIKEKEYDYVSDFPDNWQKGSVDYYKCPVNIGHHACFVKRLENERPENTPGWDLLTRLKYLYKPNLPRIYDIVSTEENSSTVYYIIYEYLHGVTLNQLLRKKTPVDLIKLTNDLFSALASLHNKGFWFSNLSTNAIFLEDTGRFLLMDLDSAQPTGSFPETAKFGSKDYVAPVTAFFKDVLQYERFTISDITGTVLNNLEVIFLLLHIKLLADNRHMELMRADDFTHFAPAYLDRSDPHFREVFARLLSEGGHSHYSLGVSDIKALIFEQIIEKSHRLSEPGKPVITSFTINNKLVRKDESFRLSWEVSEEVQLELYRNGLPFKKLAPGNGSIQLSERYDGKDKQVFFTLIALNDQGQVKSEPLGVTVTDKRPAPLEELRKEPLYVNAEPSPAEVQETAPVIILPPPGKAEKEITPQVVSQPDPPVIPQKEELPVIPQKEEPAVIQVHEEPAITETNHAPDTVELREEAVLPDPRNARTNKKIRVDLVIATIAIIIALTWVTYSLLQKGSIVISSVGTASGSRYVSEGKTVFINGKFPLRDSGKLQVLFNDVKGTITISSDKTIYAIVPRLENKNGAGTVKVAIVANAGDTVYAKESLLIKEAGKP